MGVAAWLVSQCGALPRGALGTALGASAGCADRAFFVGPSAPPWMQLAGSVIATRPLTLFAIQLALNAGWSIVFFGLRRPGAAMIEIALLWVAIAATLMSFWLVSPVAGGLLAPYLAWVTFASGLNCAIWWLNR